METKKVTVVIPTYNRAQRILSAVESVLNQTYSNLEVLVVDDGSTDDTQQVINEYKNKDGRISYIRQKNQGAPVARNNGIDHARGDYIAFNDSDDTWEPDKLEKQVKILDANLADVVFCKLKFTGSNGNVSLIPEDQPNGTVIRNLMGIGTQTLIGKRKVFEEFQFDPVMPRFQDLELLLRLTKKYKLYCLNEGLVNYSVNTDSISNNVTRLLNANKLIKEKHPDLLLEWPLVGKGIQNVTYAAAKNAIQKGDYSVARKCLTDSLQFEPNRNKKALKKIRNYGLNIGAPLIKRFHFRK
ncbi:glycosyltransferase family 2 protein [Lactobacillus johnsonii]|uniref:glycosyltransferase family 2 protein n=1 Tax=Lactobacillus johnsonii TaxID=33959 RepID=UPI0028FC3227|nr:glycosyltransferase family 2 protein [Lactobacillus johnsonii]WNW29150.1 glycosyltransferase family 2 protein [Lactobacillus johnsonii]